MDREDRAKEIASLPDYGVLALADYIESEIAKAEKKAYKKGSIETIEWIEKHTKIIDKDTGKEIENSEMIPTDKRFIEFIQQNKGDDTNAKRKTEN